MPLSALGCSCQWRQSLPGHALLAGPRADTGEPRRREGARVTAVPWPIEHGQGTWQARRPAAPASAASLPA